MVAGSSATAGYWATYRLLMAQAEAARDLIGRDISKPPEADGIYTSGCPAPQRWRTGVPFDVHLMVFGDSTAAGVGCVNAEEVPGVRIARGLAEATERRIRLSTKAISGATSKGLAGQVDAMFVAGPPPDAAVILVGGNDVTKKHSVLRSAQRVRQAVARLRAAGSVVVVGTCPDLGTVAAIPQPLRTVVHSWSVRLARAQAAATLAAGGCPVPMGDLLGRDFRSTPEILFSADGFHPSAAGYELAASHLLPALLRELRASERDIPGVPQVVPAT
ncbi:lysophospholipase L1-like esterase [Nocardia pseudobrasiliensis]|uniref:Lysophospholipase L1-like esterase n=1 Tax=Nocardia pseudobrasiliensis TaxID=45979 RepID=A0A370I852_9NOCA|nr:lysophospholipase L1-like esterase [Nocardia pseudobrasiliensis]